MACVAARFALTLAAAGATGAALGSGRGFVFVNHHLAEREHGGPVEIDLGVLILDGANRLFVERGAAQDDARGRAVPVQQARPLTRAVGMQQECVLETATVAGEAQERHGRPPIAASTWRAP